MTAQLVRITSEVEIPYLAYRDQPVLTFALIDKVHGRPDGTAGRNFRANRKRFIASEDFYELDSQSLDEFRRNHPGTIGDSAQHAVLITESGYLMLVKSFTDDLSWQIQRQLVKLYFRVKEAVNQPAPPPGFVAEELINGSQVAEIKHLVWQLGRCYHMTNGGEWAAFALVRENFGVQNTYQLPARHYPEALALLQWAERLSSEFKHRVIEIERKFMKSRFKVCPPELDRLANEAPGLLLRP